MSGKPPFTTLHPVSHDPVGNKAFSLVSPDWVAAHFNEPDLRIIDVRPVHDYLAAHVPNAVHIPEAAIQSSRGSLPAQYIDPPEMAALFGRAGIGADTRVVLYFPAAKTCSAPRSWRTACNVSATAISW